MGAVIHGDTKQKILPQEKEPDRRREMNRNELSSLKNCTHWALHRETQESQLRQPSLEVWPSLPAPLQSPKVSERVVRGLPRQRQSSSSPISTLGMLQAAGY